MTPTEDREIVEALATKVMGLPVFDMPRAFIRDDNTRGLTFWFYRDAIGGLALHERSNGTHSSRTWNPLANAADSKALRDRLADKYDYLLGSGKMRPDEPEFGFALFKKGATRGSANPKPLFMAEADTEFRAVALCALQAVGVEL